MRILAVETTESLGSLAAMQDGNLLLERELDAAKRTAQSLAPALKSLLAEVGWRPEEVGLVAVTTGPGSFTGLRVGVATAKAFAWAAGADIFGVDTLEVVANATPAGVDLVSVAVDAQRGDVVAATFRREADGWLCATGSAQLMPAADWLGGLAATVAVSGPALARYLDTVPQRLNALPRGCWRARAALVARTAARRYAAGERCDLWALAPRYSRPSAAEEKWRRHP